MTWVVVGLSAYRLSAVWAKYKKLTYLPMNTP